MNPDRLGCFIYETLRYKTGSGVMIPWPQANDLVKAIFASVAREIIVLSGRGEFGTGAKQPEPSAHEDQLKVQHNMLVAENARLSKEISELRRDYYRTSDKLEIATQRLEDAHAHMRSPVRGSVNRLGSLDRVFFVSDSSVFEDIEYQLTEEGRRLVAESDYPRAQILPIPSRKTFWHKPPRAT
jgi:hypothetical protein